ncbi:MAG: Sialic acid TRAP transporter permease protein SiaT [Steroidobacteraceae bacterium]|nr:Sialic acid TRAP transporter permease protein SiaT [Steroidobacteraceae bacterium]
MSAAIIIGVVAVLLLCGVALAYVIGAAAVVAFFVVGRPEYLAIVPQRMFSQMDVFAIMAMPLFIWAGELMNRSGITRALIDLSLLLVGRIRGGLGHANVLTSVFFSGISGSAAADIAALTNTFVGQMEKRGYDPLYAGALTAAASVIGPIVPPSIIFILYGAILSTDVAALFAAGLIPGLMIAAALMAMNAWIARREGHPGGTAADIPEWRPTLRKALPALTLPAVILGGIVFGVMTPIEAGAVAVAASAVFGVWSRELTRAEFVESVQRTVVLSGVIFIFLAAGALVTYLVALSQFGDHVAAFVQSFGLTGIWYLLLLMAVFLALGMGVDTIISLTLVAPLLVPVAIEQGVHPVALGMMVCLNLTLGLITPPLGGAIMMVASITGQGYWALCRRIMPFVLAELAVLLLVVLFPELSLALPRWLGLL